MKSFKEFIANKSNALVESDENNKDWKKQFIKIEKGFIPPSKLRPIIDAFNNSNSIKIMDDVSKEINMPKKSIFLTGGAVRDYLRNKTPKNYNLITNATPEQVGMILSSAGFKEEPGEGKKTWSKGNQDKDKLVSIVVSVDGEKFEIETLRKPDGEFTDSIVEDAERRDLTINSMYIELSKSDGENSKLYDPTQSGWYDITNGNIKFHGDVESKIKSDKIRMFRAIRFYCQFGKNAKMDDKVKDAIKKLRNETSKIPLSNIKDEFINGLTDPDIDPKKYIKVYNSTKLLDKVFPGIELKFNLDIPADFSNKKDKVLALAWILQDNSLEDIKSIFSSIRKIKDKEENTGWSNQEKMAIVYLLKLKEFDVDNLDDLIQERKGTGLTEDQINNWVDMFNIEGKSTRPQWSKLVKSFAEFSPDHSQLVTWNSDEVKETDPAIRFQIIKSINKNKLKDMFNKNL